MAEDKTRREFLQNASLAGAAFVAGAAAISAVGCGTTKLKDLTNLIEWKTERDANGKLNGTLWIKDEEYAQQIYEQLRERGELEDETYTDENDHKKHQNTKGSPKSRAAQSGTPPPIPSDSSAAPVTAAPTLDVMGVAVTFEAYTDAARTDKVVVNSLCGC